MPMAAELRWRQVISRSALGSSLEQFPTMGIGTPSETFSNIKTPAIRRNKSKSQTNIGQTIAQTSRGVAKTARSFYQPRYVAHLGLIATAGFLVLANNPTQAHSLSLRLMSASAGAGIVLDETTTANIAADLAKKSQFMITTEATKTATVKNQQVALLTSDDLTLSKRQVVTTAGNATRDISSYTVQPGDTLSAVASKFNITSSTIKWANDISDADSIAPGKVLTILPISGLQYTVADGDTADTLAAKFSANAAQIISFNNAEVKGLVVGSMILIPDGVKADAPKPAAPVQVAQTRGSVAGASTSITPHLTYYSGGANGYAFGYCTYYVASRRSIPSFWGNASSWYYNAQASGFSVGSAPATGAIAWSGAGYYGHVAYVEAVSGDMVTVSEMNYNGGWDRVSRRTVSASSFRYIY
jgi:surface antigen